MSVCLGNLTGGEARETTRAELCRKCYSCQDGISSDVTIDTVNKGEGKKNGAVKSSPFTWFVFPTNGCNLSCRYCYANNAPGIMTKEVMHQTLLWLFNKQPHKKFKVHFFGGEPTTQWDMLVDFVKIGNVMAIDNNCEVAWSMTTNGTLLTQDRILWIKDNFNPNAPFLLSIDGRPETHNLNRVYHNGGGSFEDIPVDLILKTFPNLECRPTITANNSLNWIEDYKYLRNRGFKHIAIEPDHENIWTEEQYNNYERLLESLGKYYILSIRAGAPIKMKWIDVVKEGLMRGVVPTGSMCGVGKNSGAIDHRGKLYACQRYASYNEPDKYTIGDIWNGWDEIKLFETQALCREHVFGVESLGYTCGTCMARQFCLKGCNASNIKHMGKRETAPPAHCELQRREVKVGILVLAELGMLALKGKAAAQKCSK